MLADNPAALGAHGLSSQDVFVVLDGQDLTADQPRHAHPVQQAEDGKHGKHVRPDTGQDSTLQALAQQLIQYHGKQNHHQGIRQGIDDIHNPHHDQVRFPSGIAGNGPVQQADEQHNQRGKETDRQGNPRTVNHADKVVPAELIRAEDMRENILTFVNGLLLQLGVGEGGQVFRALVPLAVDGDHIAVGIRDDQRRDDDGDQNDDQHDHGSDSQGIAEKLAHTVPEEGGALAHHILLGLFLIRGRLEFGRI